MTDNYEYRKSVAKQNDGDYSPFVDKQYNSYINDINNGIYTNSSLTLVNFDLGQIYNSVKHTNPSDMFIVIPVTMAAAFSNSGTIVAPVPGSSALCSLKSNFLNLIHQADISVQGKTLESTQAYINICKHFQMISEMSENDLKTLGHSVGFSLLQYLIILEPLVIILHKREPPDILEMVFVTIALSHPLQNIK